MKNIILAEDEIIIALDIKLNVQKIPGVKIELVSSATDLTEKVSQFKPDLIISDINLRNNTNGLSTGLELKSRLNIPLIIISAYPEMIYADRTHLTYPDAIFMKPLIHSRLLEKIEELLDKPVSNLKYYS